MRQHFIREGDKTTAGGVVLEGLAHHVIYERAAAFHGARISCPACKSIGKISCVGPRRPFGLSNGQQIAMENDLCICKCGTPPKLIGSQVFSGMDFDSDELQRMGFSATGKPLAELAVEQAAPLFAGADSGICLDCLINAAAAGSSTIIRG